MSRKYVILTLLLLILAASQAYAWNTATPTLVPSGVTIRNATILDTNRPPDYDNTVNSTGYYYPVAAGTIVLDDIARTTSKPIVTIAAEFGTTTTGSTFDATIYAYDVNPNNGNPGNLLGSWTISQIPDGWWIYTIDLDTPLAAPQNLWLGASFTDAKAGLFMMDPPVVGSSGDYFAQSGDNGASWGIYWFGGNPHANFGLATYPVPEPGSLLALGSGLMGLAGFAIRRRR